MQGQLAGQVHIDTQRAWANDQQLQTVRYHGIRPTDPYGRVGLRNPERGLRIETVIAEPAQRAFRPAHHVRGKVAPVYYSLGLWLPDAYESLRLEPRYAVRLANRDTLWWTNHNGQYGVNLLGTVQMAP